MPSEDTNSSTQTTHELVETILNTAKEFYDKYNESELETLLAYEWARTGGDTIPVRASESAGVRIVRRFMARLADNPELVGSSMSTIAALLLEQLASAGYDLRVFKIPISIMLGYLAKATLDEWKLNNSSH